MFITIVRYVRDDNLAEPQVKAFTSLSHAYEFTLSLDLDPRVIDVEIHPEFLDLGDDI